MNFDLDSKIDQNRERLKSDHENIRNLQNSYGYIIVYLSFIGLTFFDFITYLNEMNFVQLDTIEIIFLILLIASLILIVLTLIFFIKLFIPQKIAYDKLPIYVYSKMYSEVGAWARKNNKNPEGETKEAYLELLEKATKNNFNIYIKKRLTLYRSILFALISLIPYFTAMIIFHLKN